MQEFQDAYKGKTILVTGHTGFKGCWLSIWLHELGAKVIGFSLEKWDNEYLFEQTQLSKKIIDERGDVSNEVKLKEICKKYQPEIIFHLAAQPLVRESYVTPVNTITTNVFGTLNILECVKEFSSIKAAVIITTDKCYKNKESLEGYSEEDKLGGHDPYSASKACAELIVDSYNKSFFFENKFVATVRAGNVIGGGDNAADRIIPDAIRSLRQGKPIPIRNPSASRPWQHVIEPIHAYLLIGKKLLEGKTAHACAYNVGPEKDSIISVQELIEETIKHWGEGSWELVDQKTTKHETTYLGLQIDKLKKELNWSPRWDVQTAVQKTIEWHKNNGQIDPYAFCTKQIQEYSNN